MLCKKTYKNQVTLPKKIMEKFPDMEYFDAKIEGSKIVLIPVKMQAIKDVSLSSIREKMSMLDISKKDIKNAIKWARNK